MKIPSRIRRFSSYLFKTLFPLGLMLLIITDSCKKIVFVSSNKTTISYIAYSTLIVCAAASIVRLLCRRDSRKLLIVLFLCWVVAILSLLFSKNFTMVRIAAIASSLCFLDFKFLIKTDLVLRVSLIAFLVVASIMGIIPFSTLLRADGSVRYAFGFEHPNSFSTYLFLAFLDILILYFMSKKQSRSKDYLLSAASIAFAFLTYIVMNSQAITISFVLLSFYLAIRPTVDKILHLKYLKLIIINLFMLITLATLLFVFIGLINHDFMSLLDKMFSYRFSNYALYIRNTGISLFGANRPFSIGKAYLDSMPLAVLLNFGICSLALACILFRLNFIKMYEDDNMYLVYIFAIITLLGFTDTNMILPTQNILISYWVLIDTSRSPKTIRKREIPNSRIYVCTTYYHLLISIVKELIRDNHSGSALALCANWNDRSLIENHKIYELIQKNKIFDDVFQINVFKHYGISSNIRKVSPLKKLSIMKKYKNKPIIDFSAYSDIYLFSDAAFIGRIIDYCGYKYHLVEDGLDCYINNTNAISSKFSLRNLLKHAIGMKDMGRSKNIIDVEVNNRDGVNLKQTIKEVPRNELFDKLKPNDKQTILKIFAPELTELQNKDSSLLITQPFFEDSILESREQQECLYDKIIRDFMPTGSIVIKTHPREIGNYCSLADRDRITVLVDKYPIEVLNYISDLHFNLAVTVSSTSIDAITNADKKIKLGWDYLNKFKWEYKNEQRTGKK